MLVTVVAARPWAPTAEAIDSSFTRNEHGALAGVKSTSYAENAIALREAHAMGADEALLCNSRGELCEGTGSNVLFSVIDDHIVTPPLSSGCLNGVTRQLVIEWCGAREVVVDGVVGQRFGRLPHLQHPRHPSHRSMGRQTFRHARCGSGGRAGHLASAQPGTRPRRVTSTPGPLCDGRTHPHRSVGPPWVPASPMSFRP